MTFDDFFARAFLVDRKPPRRPFAYQRRLANEPWPELLDVPTGMGKTAAVVLAWLWKRGWRMGRREQEPDPDTPRRLVYCLPMRVLVEQSEEAIRGWLTSLGIAGHEGARAVAVHVLMGGMQDIEAWAETPEQDAILIGTQDLLLSRALMRGYAMSRFRWPIPFALLHNDAMWVFDEVQLMGAGLATSAQLEAFRRSFPLARRARSLWLSATLNRSWLETVDLRPHLHTFRGLALDDEDRRMAGDRLAATKHLERAPLTLDKETSSRKGLESYLERLRDIVLNAHDRSSQTVVIVNRVDRAQGLYRLLKARRPAAPDLLVHARFRAAERAEQVRRLRRDPQGDRIVVATQAVEAGVDISSRVLITELAPWPSLVQRFGRCNRYGEHNASGGARVLWVDADDDADVMPYGIDELASARQKLAHLTSVSPDGLPRTDEARPLTAVLRRKDLLDLFNTDPDLSGFDVDVSDYIRDGGVPGLRVFWRDCDDPNRPDEQRAPEPRELCPISIGQAKGLHKRGAWRWDPIGRHDGCWARLDREPRPGMTLLLRARDGAYDADIGFDAALTKPVPEVIGQRPRPEEYGGDRQSNGRQPVLLIDHLQHAARFAQALCSALDEREYADAVIRAARWHDVGKIHWVFQQTMHACDRAPEGVLAKSPCRGRHSRSFFRHELASMLAWLDHHDGHPERDLIAYLIAAHHGKVRMSLRAMPTEEAEQGVSRFARGIWEGDVLGPLDFDGDRSSEVRLQLALMEMGNSDQGPSWATRTLQLLGTHGPFQLAWLETLVVLSDWRASGAEQVLDEARGDV